MAEDREYKTPNLARLYSRAAADLPDIWHFRVSRLRRGERRLNLAPYVDSVEWSDEGMYGSGTVSLVKPDPDWNRLYLAKGDLIRVDVWLRGRWFQMTTMRIDGFPESDTGGGVVGATMKDDLSLLTRQKRDWRFRKTKARGRGYYPGEIARAVAKREGLRVGAIARGTKRIDKLEKKDSFGLDVIFEAYNKERAETGKRYMVRIHNGRLEVTGWRRNVYLAVIEPTIESASVTRKTKVANPATVIEGKGKIGKGKDARKVKYRYKRKAIVRMHGLKEDERDYGRVKSLADLRKQVKADYADEITVHKSGSLEITGMPFVRGAWGSMRKGEGIQIRLPAEGMKGKKSYFWTKAVRHSVSGDSYTCSIEFDDGDPWLAYMEEQDKARREAKRKRRKAREAR